MQAETTPILRRFEERLQTDSRRMVALLREGEGRRVVTLGDLDGAARRLLDGAPSLPEGSLVALQSGSGPGFLAALVGLWRRRWIPILIDGSTRPSEARRIERRCSAAARLVVEDPWLEPHSSRGPGSWLPAAEGARRLVGGGVVKLTSGSTGLPRGIHCREAQLHRDEDALWSTMELREGDRIQVAIPLSHSYGLSSVALPPLVRDAVLVFARSRHPLATLGAMRSESATFFPTVPAWIEPLTRGDRPPSLPSSLRRIVTAGAPLAPRIARIFEERYGRDLRVFYGASEAGGICYDRSGGAARRGTLGTAVDGVEIELVPVPGIDQGGRVVVRSAAVADAYLEEASSDLGDGRFATQDLGLWTEDGELALLGRLDDMVNVRGHKVRPAEVEQVIRSLEGVADVAVIAAASAEGALRAVVAADPELTVATILTHCRRHLRDHKVPRQITLVAELPRTERGKLDRAALEASR